METTTPGARPLDPIRWVRLGVMVALAAAGLWAWQTGLLSDLSLASIRTRVAGAGPWGPLAYITLFSVLQPFGVSAHLFLVVAGLCWPPQWALPIGYAGMMGAAVSAFGLARWMGRDAIQARLPPSVKRWDSRLEAGGLRTVVLIRLVCFTAFPVQMMLAVSKVRFRDYVLGTAIGNLPVLVLIVVFADRIADWMGAWT